MGSEGPIAQDPGAQARLTRDADDTIVVLNRLPPSNLLHGRITMNPLLLTSLVVLTAAFAFVGCSPTPEESVFAERLDEADQTFRSGQYADAGVLFEAIANEAETAGDVSAFVEAASMRARSYLIQDDGETGRPWLDRAAAKATEGDALGWSRYIGVRGRFE
jgi:hypothetical protein